MTDILPERTLRIGDAVSFSRRQATLHGHLLERQGRRRFAQVIDAENRIWKVPESMLTATESPRCPVMLTPHVEERAAWRVGDRAAFDNAGERMQGEIVKLNPKSAKLRCSGVLWNVPYRMLQRVGTGQQHQDGAERLRAVAAMARSLMDTHGLQDWTLAFVEARRYLGVCQFHDRVIRIACHHAIEDSDEAVRDTVLHEIAHAMVGREAGHGPQWKATARRIGAVPQAKAYDTDMHTPSRTGPRTR